MIECLPSVKMEQIYPINYLACFQIHPFSSTFEVQFFVNNSCIPHHLTQNKSLDELLERSDEINFVLQMP